MEISQELYDKLVKKQFYKFICGNALYNCFKHKEVIDKEKLEDILNKYKIFRYATDKLDYDIYNLFHNELHHTGPYLTLVKPTLMQNKTLWLDSGQSINDLLSDDSIIESNVQWNISKLN